MQLTPRGRRGAKILFQQLTRAYTNKHIHAIVAGGGGTLPNYRRTLTLTIYRFTETVLGDLKGTNIMRGENNTAGNPVY